jgi:hypothetical protein
VTTPDSDADSPAERALEERLEVVRGLSPRADAGLAAAVVRAARWQRAVRAPLILGGLLARAAAEGLGLLVGRRREPRP